MEPLGKTYTRKASIAELICEGLVDAGDKRFGSYARASDLALWVEALVR